ncbi:nitrile hydratase [Chloropicon primus]|nr:nitrile hydratase [Chloropicon primus]
MNATAGSLGVHDAGGATDFGAGLSLEGARDKAKEALLQWEIEVCAVAVLMSKKGLRVVDESRRHLELLPPDRYGTISYWAKWACGTAQLSMAAKIFTQAELDVELGGSEGAMNETSLGLVQPESRRFSVGAHVRVRSEADSVRWRRPHLRTPGYVHGACGVIVRAQGPFANPEEVSFYSQGPRRTDALLYTVRFLQAELWPHYTGGEADTVDVDIFEGWLADAEADDDANAGSYDGAPSLWRGRGSSLVRIRTADSRKARRVGNAQGHVHHHSREAVERAAVDREAAHNNRVDKDGAFAALHAATVRLLVAKGILARDELRAMVETLDTMAYGQTMEGAKLVARAWCDEAFKALLLTAPAKAIEAAGLTQIVDARGGIGSTRAGIGHLEYMGTASRGAPSQALAPIGDTELVVVENTDEVHNLVVCTLCSCYPRALLGLPPRYFTSRAYRARAVCEPRAVLEEFGCALRPSVTTVRVHDSTADVRFLVLPQRPAGTEGWSEEELRPLATRDCLVGVALPVVGEQR